MSTPFMPFYVSDFEADTGHLTLEEDGAYNRLLRLCWRTTGCSVPNDSKWIARRMKVDVATFENIVLPIIDEFFTIKNGRVFQVRQLAEFNKTQAKVKAARENGKKGGRPAKRKKNNNKTEPTGLNQLNPEKSYLEPEPIDTSVSIKDMSDFGFDEFWKSFGDKRGRKDAYSVWIKNNLSKKSDAIIAAARRYSQQRVHDKTKCKMPQGWLSGERWKDDISTITTSNDQCQQPARESAANRMVRVVAEKRQGIVEQSTVAREYEPDGRPKMLS